MQKNIEIGTKFTKLRMFEQKSIVHNGPIVGNYVFEGAKWHNFVLFSIYTSSFGSIDQYMNYTKDILYTSSFSRAKISSVTLFNY